MTENDFMRQQQAAVERMREMNARAAKAPGGNKMPPIPSFVRVPPQKDIKLKKKPTAQKIPKKKYEKSPTDFSVPKYLFWASFLRSLTVRLYSVFC